MHCLLTAWHQSGFADAGDACGVAQRLQNLGTSYVHQPDFRAFGVLCVHMLHVIDPASELGLKGSVLPLPIADAIDHLRKQVCSQMGRIPPSIICVRDNAEAPRRARVCATCLVATVFWFMGRDAMLSLFVASAFAAQHLQPPFCPPSIAQLPRDPRAAVAVSHACAQLDSLADIPDLPPLEGAGETDWWLWPCWGQRDVAAVMRDMHTRILECHGMCTDRSVVRSVPPGGGVLCKCHRLRRAMRPYAWHLKAMACERLDHPLTGKRFLRENPFSSQECHG